MTGEQHSTSVHVTASPHITPGVNGPEAAWYATCECGWRTQNTYVYRVDATTAAWTHAHADQHVGGASS